MRPLALALLALACAGCAGDPPPPAGPVGALDLLPAAWERARDWDPGAVLSGALALEVRDAKAAHERQAAAMAQRPRSHDAEILRVHDALRGDGDAQPGDGLAARWGFWFEADGRVRTVVVASDGTVVLDEDRTVPGGNPPDLPPEGYARFLRVDSDTAALAVAAESPDFAAAMRSPTSQGQVDLRPYQGHLVWWFTMEDGAARQELVVDTEFGSVLSMR